MTDFKEFAKLVRRIPKERLDNVWFIQLRPYEKRPIGGSWLETNKHLDYYKVKTAMSQGYNIGIVALPGGIQVIDLDTNDNKELLAPQISRILDRENTFTVRTRSNGLHYYFLNEGCFNTQDIKINSEIIGELRSNISYVLAPGCNVIDLSQKYIVVKDEPIKQLSEKIAKNLSLEWTDNIKKVEPTIAGKTGRAISERHRRIIERYKEGNK